MIAVVGMERIIQARRTDASKERKKKEHKTSQTLKGQSTAQRWLDSKGLLSEDMEELFLPRCKPEGASTEWP